MPNLSDRPNSKPCIDSIYTDLVNISTLWCNSVANYTNMAVTLCVKIPSIWLSNMFVVHDPGSYFSLRPVFSQEEVETILKYVRTELEATRHPKALCYHLVTSVVNSIATVPIKLLVPYIQAGTISTRTVTFEEFARRGTLNVRGKFGASVYIYDDDLNYGKPCVCRVGIYLNENETLTYDFSGDYDFYYRCRESRITDETFRTCLEATLRKPPDEGANS